MKPNIMHYLSLSINSKQNMTGKCQGQDIFVLELEILWYDIDLITFNKHFSLDVHEIVN